MDALALTDGDEIEIRSENGVVRAIARTDDSLRPGVITVSHGWGGAPGHDADPRSIGTNVNPLISDHQHVESVNERFGEYATRFGADLKRALSCRAAGAIERENAS